MIEYDFNQIPIWNKDRINQFPTDLHKVMDVDQMKADNQTKVFTNPIIRDVLDQLEHE